MQPLNLGFNSDHLPVLYPCGLELTFALVLRTSTFRLSFFWQLLLPLTDSLSSHGSLLRLSSSSNENNTKTDCRVQNKSKGSGAKLKLGFKSQLCPLVNLWRWASYGAFLGLNFLIFKTRIKWTCLWAWISPQKEAWERVPAELNFPRVTLPTKCSLVVLFPLAVFPLAYAYNRSFVSLPFTAYITLH